MPARILLMGLATALAAACAPSPSASSPTPAASPVAVRLLLGFRPDVQFAPFYLAQQSGLYANAGLSVSIEYLNGPDLLRLVASGEAPFGVADATDVIIARSSGIPVRYASTLYDLFPVALMGPAGSVPSHPAELAGLTIGTPGRFGSSWHALLALLAAGGLTADDVTIREYPQFNQVEGLLNGDVDLITGFRNNEPLRLAAAGMAVQLLTVDDVAPLPGPGVIVGDELLSTDPGLVEAFLRATASAQAEVIAQPEVGLQAAVAAVPTIAEDLDTARRVLEATVELWSGASGFGGGVVNLGRWQGGYLVMRDLGFIDGSVPLEDMISDILGAS